MRFRSLVGGGADIDDLDFSHPAPSRLAPSAQPPTGMN
jgi:hypothetical protein